MFLAVACMVGCVSFILFNAVERVELLRSTIFRHREVIVFWRANAHIDMAGSKSRLSL
jgi:hypothetical protein